MDDLKQLKIVKNVYIIMSLLFCALGIFLMAKPESSVRMLCVLMGTMLILYGIIKVSGYFTRDAFCLAFQFDLHYLRFRCPLTQNVSDWFSGGRS